MKVLHVISSAASGGAEIYVKDLSKAMVLHGHEVFIAFLDRASEAGRDLAFEESFLSELEEHGIEYGFLGQECRKNPLRGTLRLGEFCQRFNPDIVHSHLYYGSAFAWLLRGVKRVYTHHNIKLNASPWVYRFLDLRVDAYIGICRACYDMLKSVTRRHVEQIDNGVDFSRILPKISYVPEKTLKLLFVGTLSVQKNLGLLFQALANLSGGNIRLIVAGEGSREKELKALVRRLNIEEKVSFVGNNNNIKNLMNEVDMFVMSSAWEGLPISQIEATLTGLPVLVTDVGGCGEIVDRVENGLVAKVELEDYTAKLKQLVGDEALRRKYHQNALNNGKSYTVDSAVSKHLSLYTRLLER